MNPKKILIRTAIFCFSIFFSSCRSTSNRGDDQLDLSKSFERVRINQSYKQLAILDMDQVVDLVNVKLRQFERDGGTQSLREAALTILSRPNDDFMVEKILSNVRNPLEEENEWEESVEGFARQSVETLREKNAPAVEQVNSSIVLENIVAELKPEFTRQYKTGGFETKIINYIADAGITFSKAAQQERGLYLMRGNLNPTELAKKLIRDKEKFLEKAEKKGDRGGAKGEPGLEATRAASGSLTVKS